MERKTVPNGSTRQICAAQIIGTFGGGGAERLAYNLAAGLAQQGVRSVAIALRAKGNYGEAAGPEIKLVSFGANTHKPLSLIRTFAGLRRLIRQERIDLLHVHGAPSLPFVVLATRLSLRQPRLVFTWQDSESVLEKKGWWKQLMVWALRRCDAVSGSSRVVAQKLRDRAGLERVGVFHGGVPVCAAPGFKGSSSPLIVWLGRIVPPKDPQILIRAAARLRDEGLRFSVCIAGKPIPSTAWYMDETRALIEKLGLGDVVSAPGFVPDDELEKIIGRAEISVQTSHTEGLSIALMEHMMSGLAIVATDVGDTTVAVEDGVSGIIIPPKDEQRLTDALRRLLTDSRLRQQFAAAARQRAVDHLSIHAMANRAAEEYVALLGRT